ncbi:MAG: hypothetical protein QXO86_06505 [Nitrososphaerota archaeon]
MERTKRLLDSILSLDWVLRGKSFLMAAITLTTILIISGVVFVAVSNVGPFYGREIFAPTQTIQTIAEFIVIAAYYALGLTGLIVYYYAATGRLSDRAAGYATLAASILILFATVGLISGFTAKI